MLEVLGPPVSSPWYRDQSTVHVSWVAYCFLVFLPLLFLRGPLVPEVCRKQMQVPFQSSQLSPGGCVRRSCEEPCLPLSPVRSVSPCLTEVRQPRSVMTFRFALRFQM